jgi:hypothetical protein
VGAVEGSEGVKGRVVEAEGQGAEARVDRLGV